MQVFPWVRDARIHSLQQCAAVTGVIEHSVTSTLGDRAPARSSTAGSGGLSLRAKGYGSRMKERLSSLYKPW